MASYVLSEGDYFSSLFKEKIELAIFPKDINKNKKALFWYFNVPKLVSSDSKNELNALKSVFITSLNGNTIITIGTTQFENQKIKDIENHLFELIKTIKISKSKKVCSN